MKRPLFLQGLQQGIPIALGYLPIAIAFGLLTASEGLPYLTGIMMSLTVFAGASQFVAVNLMSLGAAAGEIILTTFILNFRHFLMSASLSQRLEESTPKLFRSILSFGITDETFSLASVIDLDENKKLSFSFLLGPMVISFTAWNAGTWVGLFMGNILPEMLQNSMGIALYVMFIGLLVPSMKGSLPIVVVALSAMLTHSAITFIPWVPGFSTGWNIILSTMVGAFLGTILFPKEDLYE
ncbi:AzlC family ABC transporter permease [Isachenkonia alkalipeptolytica]|uniref:AzlC family ABC transporter permease n=1 Tax=Isachenkonia alkalipeptolytica TaxID=2565777 RepID=A0AA44BF05_9CLOT|nr:AzlC family ABC transporter permease [Isachenkonia alkalipeptolytica]NBG88710.1 AzlC family ABC transporter permease [Isachenkonia alkalipeptolytica]